MAMLYITKENYQELVEQSAQPVLLEFWAPWCTYCRRIAGVVAKLPEAYAGRAAVAQVNIDEQPDLAAQFRVMSIPTAMLFVNGQPTQTLVGVQPKARLEAMVK